MELPANAEQLIDKYARELGLGDILDETFLQLRRIVFNEALAHSPSVTIEGEWAVLRVDAISESDGRVTRLRLLGSKKAPVYVGFHRGVCHLIELHAIDNRRRYIAISTQGHPCARSLE